MAYLVDSVQLGPVNNGRQSITLPNRKTGAYVILNSTPEKVDEYMQTRGAIEKKSNKRSVVSLVLSVIAGIGAAFISKGKLGSTLVEKLVLGSSVGAMAGLIPVAGFIGSAQNKVNKLNEKFIAENS